MFVVDERSHFGGGVKFELARFDLLVTAARLVISVLQRTDFWFGLNLDFPWFNFHVPASRLVCCVLEGPNFRLGVPLQLDRRDLQREMLFFKLLINNCPTRAVPQCAAGCMQRQYMVYYNLHRWRSRQAKYTIMRGAWKCGMFSLRARDTKRKQAILPLHLLPMVYSCHCVRQCVAWLQSGFYVIQFSHCHHRACSLHSPKNQLWAVSLSSWAKERNPLAPCSSVVLQHKKIDVG